MKGLGDIMKQAQQLQENMQQMQEELGNLEVEGQAGGGMVKVIMTGRHDVKNVMIEPEVFSEEKSLLEDLLAAAVNDAVKKVEEKNKEKMGSLTGGFQMPPGFKMPF